MLYKFSYDFKYIISLENNNLLYIIKLKTKRIFNYAEICTY